MHVHIPNRYYVAIQLISQGPQLLDFVFSGCFFFCFQVTEFRSFIGVHGGCLCDSSVSVSIPRCFVFWGVGGADSIESSS